jgi:hypothetical protein
LAICLITDEATDGGSANPKLSRDCVLRLAIGVFCADMCHGRVIEFCGAVPLAATVCPVDELIGLIPLRAARQFPRQMRGRHAGKMALAARMCRLVLWCWRFTMREDAHFSVRAVPCIIPPIRVNQAVSPGVVFIRAEPLLGIAWRSPPGKRVAVRARTIIVFAAQPLGIVLPSATLYRANSFVVLREKQGHRDLGEREN